MVKGGATAPPQRGGGLSATGEGRQVGQRARQVQVVQGRQLVRAVAAGDALFTNKVGERTCERAGLDHHFRFWRNPGRKLDRIEIYSN